MTPLLRIQKAAGEHNVSAGPRAGAAGYQVSENESEKWTEPNIYTKPNV